MSSVFRAIAENSALSFKKILEAKALLKSTLSFQFQDVSQFQGSVNIQDTENIL